MNQECQPSRLFLLLQLPVLIVGCGVIASIWRMADLADERDRQVLAEQKRFHTESIAALSQLATNAGLLTSADLSPVRFRLRMGSGHSIPNFTDGAAHFRLWICSETARESVMASRMDTAGTVDFGLNPPGSYQLELRMPDGMFLVHNFDVLPGVPVDRLVCCPQTAIPSDVSIQLDLEWPAALAESGVMAVCRIEPARFVDGEWNWEPAPHCEPVWVVTAVDAPAPKGQIANLTNIPESELRTAGELSIPYLYCQISEIVFLVHDTGPTNTDAKLTHLVTARFEDGAPTAEQTASDGAVAIVDVQPLQFTTATRQCRIELPEPVIETVKERVSSDGLHEEGLVDSPSSTVSTFRTNRPMHFRVGDE